MSFLRMSRQTQSLVGLCVLAAVATVLVAPLITSSSSGSRSALDTFARGGQASSSDPSASSSWRPYLDRLGLSSWDSEQRANRAKLAWTAEERPSKNETEEVRKLMWNEWQKYSRYDAHDRSSLPLADVQAARNPALPYTGAIVWLTRPGHLQHMASSLESLARFMPMAQPYTYLFFHQGDLNSLTTQRMFTEQWLERADHFDELGETALAAKMRVMSETFEWSEINMSAPDDVARHGLEHYQGLGKVMWDKRWPGYHSMCRFYATEIFWTSRMRHFDYYMRMDTDSAVLSTMTQDPFQRMHENSLVYAYRHVDADPPDLVDGIADFVEEYAKHHPAVATRVEETGIVQQSRNTGGRFRIFYNNFEMVHVPSFQAQEVEDWLSALAGRPESFYVKRWGDAPLRYATVHMFFDADKFQHWQDFTYWHAVYTMHLPDAPE